MRVPVQSSACFATIFADLATLHFLLAPMFIETIKTIVATNSQIACGLQRGFLQIAFISSKILMSNVQEDTG